MSNLIPTAPNSRFRGWTVEELRHTAAAVTDETQNVHARLYAAECTIAYLKELIGILEVTPKEESL